MANVKQLTKGGVISKNGNERELNFLTYYFLTEEDYILGDWANISDITIVKEDKIKLIESKKNYSSKLFKKAKKQLVNMKSILGDDYSVENMIILFDNFERKPFSDSDLKKIEEEGFEVEYISKRSLVEMKHIELREKNINMSKFHDSLHKLYRTFSKISEQQNLLKKYSNLNVKEYIDEIVIKKYSLFISKEKMEDLERKNKMVSMIEDEHEEWLNSNGISPEDIFLLLVWFRIAKAEGNVKNKDEEKWLKRNFELIVEIDFSDYSELLRIMKRYIND